MNKYYIAIIFIYLTYFNAEALSKKKIQEEGTDKNTITAVQPPPKTGTFLETSTNFELFNFYEYTFYVQAYLLYDAYALNTGLSCSSYKKQYGFTKKLDANAASSFCRLIGSQIGSSYLSGYLCQYISNLVPYFNYCSY